MITAADLREKAKQQPFVPFRIWMSSGQSVDVLHPEFIMIGKRFAIVGKPLHAGDSEFDGVQQLSILHITAVELLGSESSKAS